MDRMDRFTEMTITVLDHNFEFSLGDRTRDSFVSSLEYWVYSVTEKPRRKETALVLTNRPLLDFDSLFPKSKTWWFDSKRIRQLELSGHRTE